MHPRRRKLVVQLSTVKGRNLLQLEIYLSIYLYSLLSNYNNLYECDLRACERLSMQPIILFVLP